jgi:hypothetical protein
MAAAEFYGGGLAPPRPSMPASHQPSSSHLGPPPGPQRASSHPNVNFNSQPQQQYQNPYQPTQGQPPPPYEQSKPSVHFAQSPRPQEAQRPNSFSGPRPNPQSWAPQYGHNPPYPPPAIQYPQAQQQQYLPQQYQNNYSQPPRPHNHHLTPYGHPNDSKSSLSGYSSDPEPHRRRHRHRHEHSRSRSRDHSGRKRRTSESSRSANADGFIGAAGGGLIGDLIFPGLGTVGGALAGWIGGKDYGEKRKKREDRRDKSQYEWEERFHKKHGDREGQWREYEKDGYEPRRRSHDDRYRKGY